MANKNVKVTEVTVVNGKPLVRGTVGEIPFEAAPKQWGSKMLMKVTSVHEFTQGEKVSIGHASKKALKAASLVLPEAKLVRPRKSKEEPVQVTESDSAPEAAVEPTPEA